MRVLVKPLLMAAVLMIAGTAAAFDVANAVYVEAVMRSAAKACMDERFARKFHRQSREVIVFSLQGEGPLDADQIEAIIDEAYEHFDLSVPEHKCESLRGQLQDLYDSRAESLRDGWELTQELKKARQQGVLPAQ